MNIGELNERIGILEITNNSERYEWDVSKRIWALSEHVNGTNVFSKVGIGAKSLKFTIRTNKELGLNNAIIWNGRHCFITDIIKIDNLHSEVKVALIEPVQCTVKRVGKPQLDELNRPIDGTNEQIISFPACLTEKYVRQTEEYPMSTVESIYVLVTPKIIVLKNGELVTIQDTGYEIIVSHTLDEYKNEYEIRLRKES